MCVHHMVPLVTSDTEVCGFCFLRKIHMSAARSCDTTRQILQDFRDERMDTFHIVEC